MGDFIRRHSPPIRGRARMLRLVSPTIPRALLAPHGLRLSWQIVRDRRSVELRRARTRVPSQPPPASVARALALAEHGTRTAVAICEAIDAGRNPLPVALGAWSEHLRMVTAVLPAPRAPSHKPHPLTVDLHLMRGGAWPSNAWTPR